MRVDQASNAPSSIGARTRFFKLGGFIIRVDSDLPIAASTFKEKFEFFRSPPADNPDVILQHHFEYPRADLTIGLEKIHERMPWAIYRGEDRWVYIGITHGRDKENPYLMATFNDDHSRGTIYHQNPDVFLAGGLNTLSGMASDQLLFAQFLAHHRGCYLHSSGVVMGGRGMLFVGRSGAGKSTMAMLIGEQAELLCDDRNILRRQEDGFWIYGTWSHGELPIVSASCASHPEIFFLEQAAESSIVRLTDTHAIVPQLLASLVRPVETADWWERMLALVEDVACEVPCYCLSFNLSGGIVPMLQAHQDGRHES